MIKRLAFESDAKKNMEQAAEKRELQSMKRTKILERSRRGKRHAALIGKASVLSTPSLRL